MIKGSGELGVLLALATLVFAFGDHLRNLMEKHAAGPGANGHVGTIVLAHYGGYFNRWSRDHATRVVFAMGNARPQPDERAQERPVVHCVGDLGRQLRSRRPGGLAAGTRQTPHPL